jgi:pimeloyl-ACP methyl ester carboxylesterase
MARRRLDANGGNVMGHHVLDDGLQDGELVLHLHGGFSDSTALHGLLLPRLGDRYRIVGFDRRGHGQTPDTDEPFHYESMVDETIEVLERLGVPHADVVGFSDGGIVALLLARRRPELVRSMVLIGTNFHHDGLIDGWIDPDDALLQTPYGRKEVAMYTAEPTLTVEDLRPIETPALVLAGDDDCARIEHTIELATSLPNAQLGIIPGTSHLAIVEKPTLVAELIDDFLTSGGAVSTLLPIRRR